jgi:glycosyltransferase involved in cell wall biosynthesis
VKISVLCFDLSSNAAGRAYLLARLLAPRHEVSVVGVREGAEIWKPVADAGQSFATLPARRIFGFMASLPALLRLADGDLVYASKPRLPSAGIGYLRRLGARTPLLLDIDDWELGFFLRGGPWGTLGRALNLSNPSGLPWTWLMERLTGLAGGITVASRFLQQRFGGELLPHVRDTEAWQPGTADPGPARARLGLSDESLVLFLGTPREYKGVEDLCQAVGRLGRKDVALGLVGTDPASATGRRLHARYPDVKLLGPVPFAEIPAYLGAAAVVAVPQRQSRDTVGQVPAKIFDAMALGRPIVSTRVSMIPEILDGCGILVPPGDVDALAEAIARALDHPAEAEAMGTRARERCVEQYSFKAARRVLFPLVERISGFR